MSEGKGLSAAALIIGASKSGGEPAAYIKNAATNGNTLTLTKKDDTTVTFTPTTDLSAYRTSAAQDVIDAGKQATLTAGTNITIENNVISATGGDNTFKVNFTYQGAELVSDKTYAEVVAADTAGKLIVGCLPGMMWQNFSTTNVVVASGAATFNFDDIGGEDTCIYVYLKPDAVEMDMKYMSYTAGEGIDITDNVISATGGGSSYTAGIGIDITSDVIKAQAPKLTFTVAQVISQNPITLQLTDEQAALMEDEQTICLEFDLTGLGMSKNYWKKMYASSGQIRLDCFVDEAQTHGMATYNSSNKQMIYSTRQLQPKLTAGTNITIDQNTNTISATGGSAPSNMVTTDTDQTITGKKIFQGSSSLKITSSNTSDTRGTVLGSSSNGYTTETFRATVTNGSNYSGGIYYTIINNTGDFYAFQGGGGDPGLGTPTHKWGNGYFSGTITAANIPAPPSTDGTYQLTCTITSGVPTYTWVAGGSQLQPAEGSSF